jgi:hypothetical protein
MNRKRLPKTVENQIDRKVFTYLEILTLLSDGINHNLVDARKSFVDDRGPCASSNYWNLFHLHVQITTLIKEARRERYDDKTDEY